MAATYTTLFGLLAVTGMRLGEALRLDRDDVDCNNAVLFVRDSKFKKSRELPLHSTSRDAIRTYAEQRNEFISRPRAPSFLLFVAPSLLIASKALLIRFSTLATLSYLTLAIAASQSPLNARNISWECSAIICRPFARLPSTTQSLGQTVADLSRIMAFCSSRIASRRSTYSLEVSKGNYPLDFLRQRGE